jgi:hypothetical protein
MCRSTADAKSSPKVYKQENDYINLILTGYMRGNE